MTHLLTWHGTVLCRDRARGALIHRPLTGSFADSDILEIGDLNPVFQADIGHFLRDDADALLITLAGGPLAGWTISRAPDHRSLVLSRQGQIMTAAPDHDGVSLVTADPGSPARFLAIGADDLAALRDILSVRWLTDAARQPEPAVMVPGFTLRTGNLDVDLRWNLPLDLSEWPHRLTVLHEAWRIARIYRYRPLVFYAAFGDADIMRQFGLSLTSLMTTGGYDGAIVVMTDKTPAEIRTFIPPDMRATLVVLPTAARDRIAYMAARLTIGRWQDARDFQPLLYTDADIVFDRSVTRMLCAIARSDRISAAVEPREYLGTSDAVGSGLILADGGAPGMTLGFNSGTLGIPNLRLVGSTLALMGRVLSNRLTMCGRDSLPYVDQPAANYVGYRLDAVDTRLLSEYVRLCAHNPDPADRRGLSHFCWVPGSGAKFAAMRDYVQRMAEHDAVAVVGVTRET